MCPGVPAYAAAAAAVGRELTVPLVAQSIGPVRLRRRAEVESLLAGWDVLAPGLVDVTAWPTPTGAEPAGYYAAVCAKRP